MRTPLPALCRPGLAPAIAVLLAATATPAMAIEPGAASGIAVHHTPVATADAGQDLVVPFEIEGAERIAEITLHYRQRGTAEWKSAPLRRAASDGVRFVARVPAPDLQPGVLEYHVDSRLAGGAPGDPPRPHFASAAEPHPVVVLGDDEERRQRELLAAHLYQRSQLQLRFEWTDLGSRSGVADDFWRLEGDYSYRLLGWVYSLRLGAGLIRGSTYFLDGDHHPVALPDNAACDAGDTSHHYCAIGLTYGFAELRFRLGRYVRLDLKAILGAGPLHFDGGGGGQLVLGDALGSHFDIGIEGVSTLGTRGWLRLAWDTVPRVPMSLTVEVLNLPDNGDVAGRVFLTLGYRPTRHLALELLGGYGTRGWRVGGPVLGGAAMVEF